MLTKAACSKSAGGFLLFIYGIIEVYKRQTVTNTNKL